MRFFSLFALIFLFSCSKKTEAEVPSELSEVPKVSPVEGNRNLPGYALISSSDCMSCHKDNGNFVGPSYAEISSKYTQEDAALLASKIIEGGVGVWGQVPMQAHPQLSKEQALQMVEYIMSVKK